MDPRRTLVQARQKHSLKYHTVSVTGSPWTTCCLAASVSETGIPKTMLLGSLACRASLVAGVPWSLNAARFQLLKPTTSRPIGAPRIRLVVFGSSFFSYSTALGVFLTYIALVRKMLAPPPHRYLPTVGDG